MELRAITIGHGGGEFRLVYRPGTSDENVLNETFEGPHYRIDGLSRFAELLEWHKAALSMGRTPLILDLGANIGSVANFFHGMFPGSRFVCVEPHRQTFEILKENISRLNGRAVHAGVSSQAGLLSYDLHDPIAFWAGTTKLDPEGNVAAVTVDSILEEECAAGAVPFMIKIDIEGAESDLFAGNTDWLGRFAIVFLELHDWMCPKQGTSMNFQKCLGRYPADLIVFGDNLILIANEWSALADV